MGPLRGSCRIAAERKFGWSVGDAVPVVAFDLTETRVSAGDTARYVAHGDVTGFAAAIGELLDDPEQRAKLGAAARSRAVNELDWKPQRDKYVRLYDQPLGTRHDVDEPISN